MHLTRRTFVQSLAAAGVAGPVGMAYAKQPEKLLFGICTGPENADKIKAIGFDFIEGGVSKFMQPDASDADYAATLAQLKACALPMRSCNGFIPGTFRLTGPETTHDAALAYAERACRHADQAGIPHIVFGSGGARKLPEGFDPEKGKEQFIDFCRKLAKRIEDCQVTIVLEPLNTGETNLLNSVEEGIGYVDAVDSPRIRLLADFYHMLRENESPDSIRKAGARIRHCHIAEKEKRMAPGTSGEDFRGFFSALRDIGYTGGVSCECGWPKEQLEDAWKRALETLRQQAQA